MTNERRAKLTREAVGLIKQAERLTARANSRLRRAGMAYSYSVTTAADPEQDGDGDFETLKDLLHG